jgi:hypothetical protein
LVERADPGDGDYRVECAVSHAGRYALSVLRGPQAVSGSPFLVTVAPADICAAQTSLLGAAPALASAGRPATYVIQARDTFSNPLADAGDAVAARRPALRRRQPGTRRRRTFWTEPPPAATPPRPPAGFPCG